VIIPFFFFFSFKFPAKTMGWWSNKQLGYRASGSKGFLLTILFEQTRDEGRETESPNEHYFLTMQKPENILLQDTGPNPVLKITDFGLATFVSEAAKMNTMCGTPQYVGLCFPSSID